MFIYICIVLSDYLVCFLITCAERSQRPAYVGQHRRLLDRDPYLQEAMIENGRAREVIAALGTPG